MPMRHKVFLSNSYFENEDERENMRQIRSHLFNMFINDSTATTHIDHRINGTRIKEFFFTT